MPISRRLLFLFVDMIQLNVISFIERRDAIREKKRFFPNFFSKDHTCPLPWMLKYKRIIMTIYILFLGDYIEYIPIYLHAMAPTC